MVFVKYLLLVTVQEQKNKELLSLQLIPTISTPIVKYLQKKEIELNYLEAVKALLPYKWILNRIRQER
nr:MAG TPA_asm: hypothetical protein [Caudoviricetes sp.]